RATQTPVRGIGPATLARLDEARAGRALLAVAAEPPAAITGKARRGLEDFAALIRGLADRRRAMAPPAFIDQLLDATGYREALRVERSPEAEARLENLEELIAAAEDYMHADPSPSIGRTRSIAGSTATASASPRGSCARYRKISSSR